MSHKKLRPFIVKVSVLGYFPLYIDLINYKKPPIYLLLNLSFNIYIKFIFKL